MNPDPFWSPHAIGRAERFVSGVLPRFQWGQFNPASCNGLYPLLIALMIRATNGNQSLPLSHKTPIHSIEWINWQIRAAAYS